jgi:hypothetical protein
VKKALLSMARVNQNEIDLQLDTMGATEGLGLKRMSKILISPHFKDGCFRTQRSLSMRERPSTEISL